MASLSGLTVTIIACGLIGALSVSLLFVLWTWLFHPKMFGDGQYGMVFVVTCPAGWIIGAAAASLAVLWYTEFRISLLLTSLALTVGGAAAISLPGMVAVNYALAMMGVLFESAGRIFRR